MILILQKDYPDKLSYTSANGWRENFLFIHSANIYILTFPVLTLGHLFLSHKKGRGKHVQLQDLLGSSLSTNLINESKVSAASCRCFLALQIASLSALISVLWLTSNKQSILYYCNPTEQTRVSSISSLCFELGVLVESKGVSVFFPVTWLGQRFLNLPSKGYRIRISGQRPENLNF